MDEIRLVDKPFGRTSHDIVDEVRRLTGEKRVGHAGTLDPMATGLLVLGLGKATRLLEFMEEHDKEYVADVRLGVTTDTGDAEGQVTGEKPVVSAREEIERAAAQFLGEIVQRPPVFSAIKVKGRRLYEYAREGRPIEAPERRVRVHEFTLLEFTSPLARFRVRCSKGTYVRALARDLGEAVGCGGSLSALRRTASGPFRIEDAGRSFPMDAAVAHLPEVRLSDDDARRFGHGMAIDLPAPAALVRVYAGGRFLGVGESVTGGLKPRKVLL